MNIPVNQLVNPSLTAEQIQQEKDIHYMRDKEPVDWTAFDEETAPILERVARDIYDGTASETGRPGKVSEKLIYRELDLPKHRLDNLPKCKATFARFSETYPENRARRVVWAYRQLLQTKKDIFWTDIRLMSGIKKEHIAEVLPLIPDYADADETEKILKNISDYCTKSV